METDAADVVAARNSRNDYGRGSYSSAGAVRCSAALAGCRHGGTCYGCYDVRYGFRALCCVVRTFRRINVTRY